MTHRFRYFFFLPYCYNIQNTDQRYLFQLFLDQNKNVRSKIDILLYRIQRIKDQFKKSFYWYFICMYTINRTVVLHGRSWIRILSSCVHTSYTTLSSGIPWKIPHTQRTMGRVKVSKETVVLRRWGQQGNLVISTKLKM